MSTNATPARFATNEERFQYLADSYREASAYRPAATINAEVMALVYEVAAGKDGALDALRDRL